MKMTRVFLLSIAALLALSSSALAATLQDVAWAADGDYYALLYQSIADGEVDTWRESGVADTALDAGNWRESVTAQAAHLHQREPDGVAEVYELTGLRADVYLARRWPHPECFRELRRLSALTPIMMELYLHGLASYGYSSTAHRDAEERALRLGIIAAVEESNHPAAYWFLMEVVEGLYEHDATRLAALEALGGLDDARVLDTLSHFYDEAVGHSGEQAVILRAIGKQQTGAAWRHIEPILRSGDSSLMSAALSAARSVAARRGWRGDRKSEEKVRMEVDGALLSLLPAADDALADRVVELISSIADAAVQKRLEELLSRRDLTGTERARFERTLSRVELALARR